MNENRLKLSPTICTDVTNPPDPTIVSEPVFYNPKFSNMLMEYEWGPSEEFLAGMAWWEGQLDAAVNYEDNVKLTASVADLWQTDRSAAEAILEHNPNIGVQTADGTTRWGYAAADFLHGLGANVEVVDQFGDSGQRFAHAPQNLPPRPIDKQHMLDDCKFLAATVEEFARKSRSDTTFVKALAKRFVTPSNQDSPEMREFRAGGFKGRFNDDQGSYNQVRHFVGGFSNAYYGGLAARVGLFDMPNGYDIAVSEGVRRANAREGSEETGDRNLNGVSVPLGVQLAFGRINRGQLGNLIRSQVCGSD